MTFARIDTRTGRTLSTHETYAEATQALDSDDQTIVNSEDATDMVTIEEMPDQYRSSHRAAGNWGQYPLNGAERRQVNRDEAEEIIAADEDGYDHIVE